MTITDRNKEMSKYATSVRFFVKEGKLDSFIKEIENLPNCGEISLQWFKTGEHTIAVNSVFESKKALSDARPKMIENLNKVRHLLQEISPEKGVTDPVSGPVVDEK